MGPLKYVASVVALLAIGAGCTTTAETGSCCKKNASMPNPMTAAATSIKGSSFDKPGFVTVVNDGRLWVFAEGSEGAKAYKASGKTPADHVTRVKAGPMGMTIKSDDGDAIVSYLVSKPDFVTLVKDGRLWVFAEGSEGAKAYKSSGKTPADHVTRVKAGPLGMTVKSDDGDVIAAYLR